jgi:hypothetical protein
MRIRFTLLCLVTATYLLVAYPVSAGTVLDFSDVVVSGTYVHYYGANVVSKGFTFTNVPTSDNVVDAANDADPLLTPVDGQNVYAVWLDGTNSGGGSFYQTNGNPFNLNSLDAVWWDHYYTNPGESYTITGNFANLTTQTVTGFVASGAFNNIVLNWSGLQSVSFSASTTTGSGWFAIGDINVSLSSPTPEPGSFLLLGSGVLGLAGMLRRKINL